MIIEGPFYKLIPVSPQSQFFDLEILYDVGGKNPRKEFKNAGYGLTLNTAIKTLVRYSISKKFEDETVTLEQYLVEFKHELETLKKLCDM